VSSGRKTTCQQYTLMHSPLLEINIRLNGDRAGPFMGISGTLGREEQRECCGYSEVSMW
jgi:hypothetical protein